MLALSMRALCDTSARMVTTGLILRSRLSLRTTLSWALHMSIHQTITIVGLVSPSAAVPDVARG